MLFGKRGVFICVRIVRSLTSTICYLNDIVLVSARDHGSVHNRSHDSENRTDKTTAEANRTSEHLKPPGGSAVVYPVNVIEQYSVDDVSPLRTYKRSSRFICRDVAPRCRPLARSTDSQLPSHGKLHDHVAHLSGCRGKSIAIRSSAHDSRSYHEIICPSSIDASAVAAAAAVAAVEALVSVCGWPK